jgi:hypothetical protein
MDQEKAEGVPGAGLAGRMRFSSSFATLLDVVELERQANRTTDGNARNGDEERSGRVIFTSKLRCTWR